MKMHDSRMSDQHTSPLPIDWEKVVLTSEHQPLLIDEPAPGRFIVSSHTPTPGGGTHADAATALLQSRLHSFMLLDAAGRIQSFNRIAAERCLAYFGRRPVRGDRFLDYVGARERGIFAEIIRAALGGDHVIRDIEYTGANGVTEWYETDFLPLGTAEEGQNVGVVVLSRTITARKRTELELFAAREAAEQALRHKIDFFTGIIHDIRNPLNGILPLIEMLRSGNYESDRNQFLEYMESSARMIQGLLNELLDLARIESGRLDLHRAVFSPARVVEEAIATQAGSLLAKGLTIAVEVAPTVPAWLEGDAFRLKQVLVNLLGNAIKFTSRGGITVTATLHSELPGHATLKFGIHDTGIGIPPETLATLFAPFTQGSTGTARLFGGSGLGLSICRKLAELMGGRVWAESVPERGSTFHLLLPFSLVAQEEYSI